MNKNRINSGFTVVELLIVIVVIAILAALSIVAFNGIQNRAHEASVSSTLNNLGKKATIYKQTNNYYPGSESSGMSTTTFLSTLKNDASTMGPLTFSQDSWGSFFTSSSRGMLVMVVSESSTSTNVTDFCIAAVSKSEQAYWLTSKDPTPTKGPYGTKNTITNALFESTCQNKLGFSLSGRGYAFAGYNMTATPLPF